ncbi:MAG: alcohol dehydrogenase catalytic domain-containing protein [Gammaproteobacteria bacterium]|nr:alcohol dehydrogenase catalytic domain-containing protein [Gammaproteobacteria bacterium]
MQVGLVTGTRKVDLVEMPSPRPTTGKAVVDITYCGICGTDVHAYLSGSPYNPAICGHEWTGLVSAVGKSVTNVKEGDRVARPTADAPANAVSQCSASPRRQVSRLLERAAPDISRTDQRHAGVQGADVVFECAGIPATIQHAVNYVRRGGVVSLVGVPSLPTQIDASTWLVKEVRLSTSLAYLHEEFEIAKSLVADGRVRCAPLHTSTVPLRGLADAFAKLADHPGEVKILVDPRL